MENVPEDQQEGYIEMASYWVQGGSVRPKKDLLADRFRRSMLWTHV